MSQENVRRLYGIDDLYEGHEGAAAYWEDLHSPWKSLSIDVERLEAVGNKVVTVLRMREKDERASWSAAGSRTCSRSPTDWSSASTHTTIHRRPSKLRGCA